MWLTQEPTQPLLMQKDKLPHQRSYLTTVGEQAIQW
jgi:hypothetical protein